jgi:hypothetical protein
MIDDMHRLLDSLVIVHCSRFIAGSNSAVMLFTRVHSPSKTVDYVTDGSAQAGCHVLVHPRRSLPSFCIRVLRLLLAGKTRTHYSDSAA